MFDRVAIAFGAMLLGGAATLVAVLPLFYIISFLFVDIDSVSTLLFRKIPVSLSIVSALVALISPRFAADWIGKFWHGVLYLWRVIVGS